jgi:hypothetical protein
MKTKTFEPCVAIVYKAMVIWKDKIFSGNFFVYPNFNIFRLSVFWKAVVLSIKEIFIFTQHKFKLLACVIEAKNRVSYNPRTKATLLKILIFQTSRKYRIMHLWLHTSSKRHIQAPKQKQFFFSEIPIYCSVLLKFFIFLQYS